MAGLVDAVIKPGHPEYVTETQLLLHSVEIIERKLHIRPQYNHKQCTYVSGFTHTTRILST